MPNKLQAKSPKLIEGEINYLKNSYDVKQYYSKMKLLNLIRKFSSQMEAIGNSNILWRGQTTSIGTYEQLKLKKETGCLELSVGIETVDDTEEND